MAGGTWTSLQQVGGKARDTINLNVITGPEETHDTGDYRTLIDSSLVHLWTDKLSSTVNGDWATESGAAPGGGQANWYGVAHYLTYTFNDYVSATWRTEWFADDSGVRIGRAGDFYENTVGLTLTPFVNDAVLKNLSFRPELRWDHSDEAVFGQDHDMMTAAIDVIFKF